MAVLDLRRVGGGDEPLFFFFFVVCRDKFGRETRANRSVDRTGARGAPGGERERDGPWIRSCIVQR